jgi:hypothetical protein
VNEIGIREGDEDSLPARDVHPETTSHFLVVFRKSVPEEM